MSTKKVAPIGLAAALLLAVPMIAQKEGKRNDPYKDIAGIPTVCYGETRVPMRSYSDKECLAMLDKAVEGFSEGVLKTTPTLADRPYQLAAATSLAYNIGLGNYNKSSTRKNFLIKHWEGGCNAILSWNKVRIKGKLQVSKGLKNRREEERQLCLTGL